METLTQVRDCFIPHSTAFSLDLVLLLWFRDMACVRRISWPQWPTRLVKCLPQQLFRKLANASFLTYV